MNRYARLACVLIPLVYLSGCFSTRAPQPSIAAAPTSNPAPEYTATIRWTSHGIPHITAPDMGSAGFGLAYSVATDAVCVLAEELVTVRGQRALYFGDSKKNIDSDAFYKALLNPQKLAAYQAANVGRNDAMDAGYVAGYNRYLADHKGDLPKACRDAAWVIPITKDDATRLDLGFGIRYGLGDFIAGIANAAPGISAAGASAANVTSQRLPRELGIGSNALALGKAVTANGRGLLLGNPHYPWHGGSRFHLAQITVPGQIDVMNAGLITTTTTGIGFNRNLAWSHTVSTAQRFTLFRLDLLDNDPMAYRIGDATYRLAPVAVTVDARASDGSIRHIERTIYFSKLGPVIASAALPWDDKHVYVIRDVNYENYRGADQYYAMDRAGSVGELKAALARYQGTAFVNTIAVDKAGGALYADMSAIPNISSAQVADCKVAPGKIQRPIITLDGSRPECHWQDDPTAAAPGLMPPSRQPSLITDTYAENSNDSYWLSNPDQPLEGFSPIIGDERSPRSLRTRAGLNFVEEILDAGEKFTPQNVEALITNNRNYGAELFLDDVLTICDGASNKTIGIAAACGILAKWDRRQGIDSVGAQIYNEFWHAIVGKIAKYYTVPFNPADPVHTPRGIDIHDPDAQLLVMDGLNTAIQRLNDAGVSPLARWGDAQFAIRNGEKIPIPGGDGSTGMFSVIYAPLNAELHGYNPIVAGNSYIQVVTWNDDGTPDAHIMLTYSQSPDPDSPFYADMTKLYSRSEWVKVPFTDAEINADLVRTLVLDSNNSITASAP